MNNPKISIISAIAENRAIGKDNKLLWYIPDDMKHFRDITSGHVVIMGRKTYESMGKLLPKRTNIIITRETNYLVEGAIIVRSIDESIKKAKEHEKDEIFIIGGAQIYSQALLLADRIYLTIVHTIIEGDAYFPDYSQFTKKISEQQGTSNGFRYTFLTLEKK